MSGADRCAICNSDRLEELEDLGHQALRGDISWRAAAREGGLSHHQGLKNHMEKHVASVAATLNPDAAMAQFQAEVVGPALADLTEQMHLAPAELKPLYAVAIRNLMDLWATKPSQQNLIMALKGIHEITGMKMEQRIMLEFAQRAFHAEQKKASLPDGDVKELPSGVDIVEAEVVEDDWVVDEG